MIVNPDKFQAIVIKKNCRMKDSYALNINNQTINSENCVKLLGIEIDNTLYFNKHSSTSCKKARIIEENWAQEQTLRILYNDSTSDYNQLLNK